MQFSLQGSSLVLMRVMNEAMTEGRKCTGGLHGKGGVPGATGQLYQCVIVYMDCSVQPSSLMALGGAGGY